MSKKRLSVAKRMENSTELNRKLFEYFKKNLEDQGANTNTVPSAVSLIIEATGHKDINQLEFEDIRMVFENMDAKPQTINSKIDYFKSFLRFAAERVTLQFDLSELDELKVDKSEVDANSENLWKALSVDEVIALRIKLRELKKYKSLYYFEMLYAYGLDTDILLKLNRKNYDKKEKKFLYQNVVYPLPLQLHDIPTEEIIPNKQLNTTAPTYYLKKIEAIFSRKVTIGDIYATREQTFFRCPKCGEMYEATPVNWVVFHYEIDDSKWIICRIKCLGEKVK